jgi:predicted PurR-regulated permease PerM
MLFFILAIAALYYGRPFLVPLAFAAILAMLLCPVVAWLEKKGVNKALAVVLAVLIVVLFLAGIVWLISCKVSDIANNAGDIEQSLTKKVEEIKKTIGTSLGIPPQKQQEMMKQSSSGGGGGLSHFITTFLSGLGGFLTNLLLVLVYLFLLLFFRGHLKNFMLQIFPGDKAKTSDVIEKSRQVAQKYLTGMGLMIVCLWIMYGIGFTIVGVKNAFFYAILCGLLEIVPFVGNLAGNALTIIMSVAQGAGMNVVIGILITYAVVQFIQSYLLEPLVVGAEVSINPLFTIIAIVAGELIWGVPGMILAIPLLGVLKIVCDHVEPLKPYGYLLGTDKKGKGSKK